MYIIFTFTAYLQSTTAYRANTLKRPVYMY